MQNGRNPYQNYFYYMVIFFPCDLKILSFLNPPVYADYLAVLMTTVSEYCPLPLLPAKNKR